MKPSDSLTSPNNDPSVDEAPILHVDLDAFFASVEIIDDPKLRGRAVAVGGAGERGVIASASYEARRYGVRSGMASVLAKRQCPGLIILPGRFDRYEEYSRQFHAIVAQGMPVYEPLGLDELFADLRSLRRLNVRPLQAAALLRSRIKDELKIECGIGLGPNKLFAKLASKQSKPRVVEGRLVEGPGVFWADEQVQHQWLEELPVRALWGVGPQTSKKLEKLGLSYIRQLREVDEATLALHLGPALAHTLAGYAVGRDDRPVLDSRKAKSIGHEETFARSLAGYAELGEIAKKQAGVVGRALRASGQVCRTISIVMRFDDMTSISRSQTLSFGLDDDDAIDEIACALAEAVDWKASVRLFGIHASSLAKRSDNELQLSFEIEDIQQDARRAAQERSRSLQSSREGLRDAIDDVRQRFGRSALGTGLDLADGGLDVSAQRGRHAFGPDQKGTNA